MITEQQAKVLGEYFTLIENDAFLCGEAAGTDAWRGLYQRLQSDRASVDAYVQLLLTGQAI